MIYSIFGKPPPIPASYPVTISYRDHYGVKTAVLDNETAYYGLVFWQWGCMPMGFSQVMPDERDLVRGSTAQALD